ncbi:glycerol-3-phosphate responsive antiterminator [Clostridium magnum]|uniref:Glycerol-3-phosphate responsive antiterminator n=1 Tax=Clostridium magnum DSM 2767 TaxID=1121326 RepID=A0A162UKP2_9CLOT|nr:glycerol-3-phosphate responsive antiterminator [Clostridium magnum]KZL94024.1 glycerol-3-phosphate responsive antiterminator [Clostridium magnum DSM 2767]SHI00586.1 glycerol uptake operon antiterminator [Clostridium magnum DSM 2767]
MKNLKEILVENPIIAAIRNDKDLKKALQSKASIVFVLYGDVINIAKVCKMLEEKGKIVFVHVDFIDGLKGDSAGIKFIKEFAKPHGIISTKASNIKCGNNIGLYTIQRLFVIDSLSLNTGINNIQENKPNAVEVMPGVASKIISSLEQKVHVPIIAGGLIKNKKDVMDSLAAGAIAISTTADALWDL